MIFSDSRGFVRSRGLRSELLEKRLALSSVPPTVTNVEVSSTEWDSAFIDYLAANDLGVSGYAIPVGSTAQTDELPWTNINKILITFSQDVLIDVTDLALTGIANTQYSFSEFFYDPQTRVATWTLDNFLSVGDQFLIDLNSDGLDAIQNLDGYALDGEWVNEWSTYQSGNQSAGGDFEFRFTVLPGDSITSSYVDYFDYVYANFYNGVGTADSWYDIKFDVDGSGQINESDFDAILESLSTGTPSGTPAGMHNDAPTTSGLGLLVIEEGQRSTTMTVSLHEAFKDDETPATSLTYTIQNITNGSLIDTATINSTTGNIEVNAASSGSGRSEIVVRATDADGLFVETALTIDVDYVNAAPSITSMTNTYLGAGIWKVSGYVSDADDLVEGLIVNLWGVCYARAAVDENGFFSLNLLSLPEHSGFEFATLTDPNGAVSSIRFVYLGLS